MPGDEVAVKNVKNICRHAGDHVLLFLNLKICISYP